MESAKASQQRSDSNTSDMTSATAEDIKSIRVEAWRSVEDIDLNGFAGPLDTACYLYTFRLRKMELDNPSPLHRLRIRKKMAELLADLGAKRITQAEHGDLLLLYWVNPNYIEDRDYSLWEVVRMPNRNYKVLELQPATNPAAATFSQEARNQVYPSLKDLLQVMPAVQALVLPRKMFDSSLQMRTILELVSLVTDIAIEYETFIDWLVTDQDEWKKIETFIDWLVTDQNELRDIEIVLTQEIEGMSAPNPQYQLKSTPHDTPSPFKF